MLHFYIEYHNKQITRILMLRVIFMMDWLWFFLLGGGILFAIISGNMELLTEAAFSAANDAVLLALELCGLLALWMGLLKIAESAGLIEHLGKLISPLIRRLFPELPAGHPAFSMIVMNAAANLLGLGNASTPFGLKAMSELQSLNPHPDTATAAMITLLAMNTACITLLPTTVISLRSAAGSTDPSGFVGVTVVSSTIGFVSALLIDRLFRWRERR